MHAMRITVMPSKKNSNQGVSLVEVMISLVILLIVFMGLIQASILSIDHNIRNEVRDEAVRISSETMTQTRATAFGTLAATGVCPAPACNPLAAVNRDLRNQTIPFNRCRGVCDIDADNKQVTITVTWAYRGENLTHTINSVLRNQ